MAEINTTIEVNGFNLEAALSIPSSTPAGGAVICHPHPQYGGDMRNNVVIGVKEALEGAGFATLRFNFRGVGASQGKLAGPEGDTKDLLKVIESFQSLEGIDSRKVAIAGYSYGALIALFACREGAGISSIAALSPPVGIFQMEHISKISRPILVITGDRDAFCPLDKIRKMIPAHAQLEIIKGADHFYFGQEEKAGRLTASFLKETFAR